MHVTNRIAYTTGRHGPSHGQATNKAANDVSQLLIVVNATRDDIRMRFTIPMVIGPYLPGLKGPESLWRSYRPVASYPYRNAPIYEV